MATLREKLIDSLQISEDHPKVDALIFTRLVGIECADYCTRCGGTGNYSYNPMHGSTCFKCDGRKYQMPKITKKLLAKVEEAIAEGKLQHYFEETQKRQKIKLFIKEITRYEVYSDMMFKDDDFGKYYDAGQKKDNSYEHHVYELWTSHDKFIESIKEKCRYFGRNVHPRLAQKKAEMEKDIFDNYKEYFERIRENYSILTDKDRLITYATKKQEQRKSEQKESLIKLLKESVEAEDWKMVNFCSEGLMNIQEGKKPF
ncbi:hypothetical protein [Bacillus thuringiensis]|uniref:hypothetical protein n=1 Tax=Bacillus thuringiensis TaxID=1428 RepID=UPI000BF53677|nr:hypothetical protein [Bacillus thuringiensis]EKS7858088.1 hypothetical protein [Bacillus cereus]PEV64207.1 hypothetical protein CN434_25700 [Bacillus thuringiensis]